MDSVKGIVERLFLIVFYLYSAFYHKRINDFIDIFYKKYSFALTNRIFLFILVCPFVLSLIVFLIFLLRRNIKALVLSILISLMPILIYYFLFFVSNIEAIHYIQYAIVAFLLMNISKNPFYSFLGTLILGVVDECYQYFVLYKGQSGVYLDFNDMLFNIHGALIGILVHFLINMSPEFVNKKGAEIT